MKFDLILYTEINNGIAITFNTYIQLAWYSIGVACTIAYEEHSLKFENSVAIAEESTNKYFQYLVTRHETLVQLTAYVFFLVCVKIAKYTDLNKSMTTVYLSVGRVFIIYIKNIIENIYFVFVLLQCLKIIAGYLAIMVIVVTAFAMLGYCAFGAQVYKKYI